MNIRYIIILIILCTPIAASDYKPIVLDHSYNHDKFLTQPAEIVREFRAYKVSFDGPDDDNGDGIKDYLGVPQWVAYEVRKLEKPLGKSPPRPSKWMADHRLYANQRVPTDSSYRFSAEYRENHPGDWQLQYERGHMCRKFTAFRMGANADWNTHTILNACPQSAILNRGIWLDLEDKVDEWAENYGRVWVICGPIFWNRTPTKWLGEEGEVLIAIPDAFFKIIATDYNTELKVIAFIYPQFDDNYSSKGPFNHMNYLASVNKIESLTGLDFFVALSDWYESIIEFNKAEQIWN
jgi:endonuclease G, mitochondrial